MNQQIGVAEGRQPVAENEPITIRHVGVEDITNSDSVSDTRAARQDRRPVDGLSPVRKTNDDARCDGLVQQRVVKRTGLRTTADEVIERVCAPDPIYVAPRIE